MDLQKGNAIKVVQSPPCKQSGLRMLENFYLHTLLHTGLKPDLFCPWPMGRSAALSFAWQHGAAEAGMVGVWMPSARQRCAKAYAAQPFWCPAANRVPFCLSERVDRTLRSSSYLKTLSWTPGLFPFFPPSFNSLWSSSSAVSPLPPPQRCGIGKGGTGSMGGKRPVYCSE